MTRSPSCVTFVRVVVAFAASLATPLAVGLVPMGNVTSVSAGQFHTCAVVEGGVQCWGDGPLGDGSNAVFSGVPVNVIPAGSGATVVASVAQRSCAVVNGGVQCWGSSTSGSNGPLSANNLVPVVAIEAGSGVTDVATGTQHTCAVRNGGVQCWGSGSSGQLGDSITTGHSRSTPDWVIGLGEGSGATAVLAGIQHTCAIVNDGVQCWGNKDVLGSPASDNSGIPVAVPGLTSGVTSIGGGTNHACAVANGSLKCWGSNSVGQLGDGTTAPARASPTQVVGLHTGVSRVGRGPHAFLTCAVVDGGVKCWGTGTSAQLGNGYVIAQSSVPLSAIAPGSGATDVAFGQAHACARIGGEARCWGDNGSGQLSNGSAGPFSARPMTTLPAGSGATEISTSTGSDGGGAGHSCAIVNGGAWCWGSDQFGRLGDGVNTQPGLANTAPGPIAVVGASTGAVGIAAGGEHSCAVIADQVKCWGNRSGGLLGDGIATSSSVHTPTPALGTEGATVVSAGRRHSCAVVASEVKCWGNNGNGRLGDGGTTAQSVPVTALIVGSDARAISAGDGHTCALVGAQGSVQCWGNGQFGQVGNGLVATNSTPHVVFASGATAIGVGDDHSCAVVDGGVQCWGHNGTGALGNGPGANTAVPVAALPPGSGATAVAGGERHTCAIVSGGVQCWGGGANGALGTGRLDDEDRPVWVLPAGSGVTAIHAGERRTCVVIAGGVQCWGDGNDAELGDNTTGYSTVPRPVMTRAMPTVALAIDPLSAASGQAVTMTATIAPGTASGTVEFRRGTSVQGSGEVVGGVATLVKSNFANGVHTIVADYEGDLDTFPASSAPVTIQVGAPTITVTPTALSSTVVGTVYSATIGATGGTAPYTFAVVAGALPAGLALNGSTGALTGTLSTVDSYDFTIRATDNVGFTGQRGYNLTVGKIATTVSLASSAPSALARQRVTLTATVLPPTATGTVEFRDGSSLIGAVTITAGNAGIASIQTPELITGSHSFTAEYLPGATHQGSTSAPVGLVVSVNPTTTTLTSSLNPSETGNQVTFTATVTGVAVSGQYAFDANGSPIPGCVSVGSGGNQAYCTTNGLPTGTHTITVQYSGNGSNGPSTSAPLMQVVNAPPQLIPLVVLQVSPNPSSVGESVTMTATVAGIAPTGPVAFEVDHAIVGGCAAVPLVDGNAACTTAALGAGAHAVVARYSGDANHLAGSSSPAYLQVGALRHAVAHWEGEFSTEDWSDGANHAAPYTAYALGPRSGVGFHFDGNSHVTVPGAGKYQFGTGDFSVAFWVRFDDLQTDSSGIVHKDTYPNDTRGWLFNICDLCPRPGVGMEVRNVAAGIDQHVRVPSNFFVTGRWYHMVGVRQGTQLRLYLDGVRAAVENTSAIADVSNDGELAIGSLSAGSPQFLNGAVDGVRLYDYALTDTEIPALVDARPVGRLFVGLHGVAAVSAMDTAGRDIVANLPHTGPGMMAMHRHYESLYVVNLNGALDVFDLASGTFQRTIPLDAVPGGIAIDASGTRAYIPSQFTHELMVVDLGSGSVQQVIPLPAGTSSHVAILPDGSRVYVGDQQNSVHVVETATHAVIATVTVGNFVGQLAADPTGRYVYAANINDNSVSVIDTAANAVVATVSLGDPCAGCGPASVAVHPDGSRVYAPASGRLHVIRTSDHSVMARVPVGTFPIHVSVHPDGTAAYVSNYDESSISVVSTLANAVVGTVLVSGAPVASVVALPAWGHTTTSLASSPNPSTLGQSVTLDAIVTGAAVPSTVRVLDGATAIAGCEGLPVVGHSTACATPALTLGAHSLRAVHSGTLLKLGSVSAPVSHSVATASTPTTTTLVSSLNPATWGDRITFTASVSGSAPTGTVRFMDGGSAIPGCESRPLASGQAICDFGELTVATHAITGVYSGDGANAPSTSAGLTQQVAQRTSSTTLTSFPNPSIAGEPVTFRANVSGVVPTGSVAFLNGAVPLPGCELKPVASGQALCVTGALADGSHSVTAQYSGDGNHLPSQSAAHPHVVTPAAVPTTTTLTSSPNPAQAGQSVTFTVNVSGSAPTGTFALLDGGIAIPGCGAVNLGEGRCSSSALTVGSHIVTATYSGDTRNLPSTSAPLTQVITPLDVTAPAVVSLAPMDALPTMLDQVNYILTLSEPVTGVAAEKFSLTTGGELNAPAIISTMDLGAGVEWLIVVHTGRGTGSLRLDLATGAGIADLAGNPLANAPYSGTVSPVDKGGTVVGASQPDLGFGASGFALFSDTEVAMGASRIVVRSDGNIVAAGLADCQSINDACTVQFVRYTADGDPDPTFGIDGRVMTSLSGVNSLASLAIDPDGKLRVAGTHNVVGTVPFVAAFNPDGSPATTYGAGGLTSFPGVLLQGPIGAVYDANGRAVMVGSVRNGSPDVDTVVIRVDANGMPDSTFGTNGTAQFGFSTVTPRDDVAYGVDVQPDGRIVIGGASSGPSPGLLQLLVFRLGASGSLDPSFGNAGVVLRPLLFPVDQGIARAIAVQPDGRIVVAGMLAHTTGQSCLLMRLNADGSPDTFFGTNGEVLIPVQGGCAAIALQPDGKLVLSAADQDGGLLFQSVVRALPNGAPDTSFSDGGIQKITSYSHLAPVAVATDGTILTSITMQDPDDGGGKGYIVGLVGASGSIVLAGGSPQSTPLNAAFAEPLRALVRDGTGQPAPGTTVTFTLNAAAGASGSFAGLPSVVVHTDGAGVATSPAVTANGVVGAWTASASVFGLDGVVTFQLTNLPSGPSNVVATGGTPQSALTSTAYGAPLQATVRDGAGNPVSGATVTFTLPSTGATGNFPGTVKVALATTNAAGIATSPVITATGTAGTFTATATSGALAPATFQLTNVARTGTTITATGGVTQSTVVGTPFAQPMQATVTAAGGVPVVGLTVTFTIPGTTVSAMFPGDVKIATAVTDASGVAIAPTATATTRTGTYVPYAAAPALTRANFSLTNLAGDPVTITPRVGAQTANVYATFATAPSVVVRDQYGNPVVGRTIGFVSPGTGASGTFAIDGTTTTGIGIPTNASGIATAPPFTANGIVGSYAIRAVSLFPAPIETTFPMTNRTGTTSTYTLLEGSPQSTVAGLPYPTPLKVVVRAANGMPVENAQVTFTLPTGTLSATFAGATPASAVVLTGADGTATSPAMTAKTRSGTFNARVAVAGISGSLNVPLDVLPDAPVTIQANGVSAQSAVVNTAFVRAPSVRVLDVHGNRVPGVAVVFDVPLAGPSGSFAGGPSLPMTTDGTGVATMPPITANGTIGVWNVTVSSLLPAITFRMTNTIGTGATIAAAGGTPQSSPRGSAFAAPLQALVLSGAGAPVGGVTVTFTLPSSATTARFQPGNLRTVTAITGTDGVATTPVPPTAGSAAVSYVASATASGTTGPASFNLTNQ